MASDYLLLIDGIKGESTDAKHPGSIDIESFSWGLTHPALSSERAAFKDIHFSTPTNKTSPTLFLACASAMHFAKATLYVNKRSEKASLEYYKITLEDCLVTEFSSTGEDGTPPAGTSSAPTDQFSMNFAKITFLVRQQNADGTVSNPVVAGWDVRENTKI